MPHSPSPWKADVLYNGEDGGLYEIGIYTSDDNDEIAILSTDDGDIANLYPGLYSSITNKQTEQEVIDANAKLITAAPELLQALVFCLSFLTANDDGEEDVVERIKAAKSAIAKATGEQHG